MRHQIRVAPEVEKLFTRLNAQVHSAWYGGGAASAPRWLLGQIGFWVAGPSLDAAYQRQLLALTRARRAVADVATSRKRLELQIGELERRADDLTGPLTELRRQYADMQAKEERVSAASRRLAAEVDAFRTGQEATRAAYTAAEEAAKAVYAEVTADHLACGDATGEEPGSG